MPFVERADGVSVHFQIDDFTDPWKDAPYILLQHGVGRSTRLWNSWIPYLARSFKVLRTDLRGCGQSSDLPANRPLKVEDYVGDLLAVMAHLNVASMHYCGDSFGGIIGQIFAATHPDRVRTLAMLSSPVFLDEQNLNGISMGRPSWQAALTELGPRGWADAMHDGVLMDRDGDPALIKWYADDMARSRIETLLPMSRMVMSSNATPYLSRIRAPVLGLYPTHGTLTSTEQERLLRENVADLTYIRLPSRFHMAQHIAPAASARHVLYFAAQHDGTYVE